MLGEVEMEMTTPSSIAERDEVLRQMVDLWENRVSPQVCPPRLRQGDGTLVTRLVKGCTPQREWEVNQT